MYYLNCTRRADDGRIIERFKAPATHFFKLIADEAVYVDFDRFFIRAIEILSRSGQNDRYGAPGGVYEAFWRSGRARNFKEVLVMGYISCSRVNSNGEVVQQWKAPFEDSTAQAFSEVEGFQEKC